MSARALHSLIAAVAAVLLLPVAAVAGVNVWSAGAEEGGAPASAAIAGSRAFAGIVEGGTGGGLFRSTDTGATWSRVGSMGYREVEGIAIDAAPGEPVYAATRTGVLRSLDGGTTWAEIAGSGTGTGGFYTAVAVDGGRPGTAFFARVAFEGGGVYRTAVGGAGFWDNVSGGLGAGNTLDGIVVDPFTHVAWGWQYGGGVFTLADGATTWAAANVGLPSTSVIGIAVDGTAGRVIAATTSGPASLPNTGGASWTPLTGGLSSTYLTALTGDAGGAAYAATIDNAVWRLASGATTWTHLTGGLPAGYEPGLVADATVAGHVLALSPSGPFAPNAGQGPLWRTTNAGINWTKTTGIRAVSVAGAAPSPFTPGLVIVATDADAVQRSTDGGKTWSSGRTGLPSPEVFDVAFDSKTKTIAYASTNASGTFRSTDAGKTWTKLAGGAPNSATVLQSDPLRPGTIYAGDGGQLYRSVNSGVSWVALPTAGLMGFFYDRAIVPDPAAPGAIYAVGTSVYHLDLGATTWTTRNGGLGSLNVEDIAVDPHSASTWLAATLGGGVYESTDGAHTWHVASNGIPDTFVNDVAFDPLVAHTAYASTSAGVYRTRDGGAHWTPLTGGLALPYTLKLRFDADHHTLYGTTHAIGLVARTNGVKPSATAKLRGKARVGSRLTLKLKAAGFPVPKASIKWQRCDAKGKHCSSIRHARSKRYKLQVADRGHRVRAVVTLKNAVGKSVRRSKPTRVVA